MGMARRSRLTLAKIMALNAVLAVLLAASRLTLSTIATVLAWGWTCLLIVILGNVVVDIVVGVACPKCRNRALRRLAMSFGLLSYYQCAVCGGRWKRWSFFSTWRDASGPEDAGRYRRKSAAGNWLAYSRPEGGDTCSGKLLRSKRLRNPALVPEDLDECGERTHPHDGGADLRRERTPQG